MEVDPIESTLKAPVAKRLKLKYEELLSSFAFNFDLRRYPMYQLKATIAGELAPGRDLHSPTFQLNLSRF